MWTHAIGLRPYHIWPIGYLAMFWTIHICLSGLCISVNLVSISFELNYRKLKFSNDKTHYCQLTELIHFS